MGKNITEMNQKEQDALLAELAKLRANEMKAKQRSERLRVKNTLMVQKAVAAKITVSDEEIDAYIKNMKK